MPANLLVLKSVTIKYRVLGSTALTSSGIGNILFPKKYWACSRKNFKLLFCAGIVLVVRVQIYIFRVMRMTNAILPGSPPWGNIKERANHFSPSSRFPTGQQQDKPGNMTKHILSLRFLTG